MPALIGDILNKLSKDLFESEYFLICDPEEEITFIAKIDLIFRDYYTTRAFIESGEYFVVYDADDSPIQFTFLSIGSEHEVKTLLGCLEKELSEHRRQKNKRMRTLFEWQVILEKKYYRIKSDVEKRFDSLEVSYDEKFSNLTEEMKKNFGDFKNELHATYTKDVDNMLPSLYDQITKTDSLRAEESEKFYTSLSSRVSSCEEKQKEINDSFKELESKSELRLEEITHKQVGLNAWYEHLEAQLEISKQIQTQLDSNLKIIARESSDNKRNAQLFVKSLEATVHALKILVNSGGNHSRNSMDVPDAEEPIEVNESPIAKEDDENSRLGESSACFNDELTEEIPSTLEHKQHHPSTCPSQSRDDYDRLEDAGGVDNDPEQQELTVLTNKSAKDDCGEEGDKRHQSDDDEMNMAAKRLRRESNDDDTIDISKFIHDFESLRKRVDNHDNIVKNFENLESRLIQLEYPKVTYVELKAAFSAMSNDDGAKSQAIKWITDKYGPNSLECTQLIDKIFSPHYVSEDQWPKEMIERILRAFFRKEIEGFYHMVKRKDTGEPETRGNVRKTRQVSYTREKEFAEFLRLLFPGLPVSRYWEKYVRSRFNDLTRNSSSRRDTPESSSGNTFPPTLEKEKEKEGPKRKERK